MLQEIVYYALFGILYVGIVEYVTVLCYQPLGTLLHTFIAPNIDRLIFCTIIYLAQMVRLFVQKVTLGIFFSPTCSSFM